MNHTQHKVLLEVRRCYSLPTEDPNYGAPTVRELADAIGLGTTATQYAIDSLVELELLTRRANRPRALRLTGAGFEDVRGLELSEPGER